MSLQIGSAKVIDTQPRMPCYKLGVKFGRMDIVRRFFASDTVFDAPHVN
jgi:MOSC domain-containing protein YiiM